MNLVMPLLALITLPVVLLVMFSPGFEWPRIVRGVGLAVFLVLLVAIWRRDWSRHRRALIFFAAAYSLTAFQCTMSGLVGSGRTALLLLPILALILVGSRAGWVAAGVSVIMFGAFTALAAAGMLAGKLIVRENSIDPVFWLVQGLMLLAALIPLMVLLTRFQALQTKVMIADGCARRELEAAAAERRGLEEEISRITENEQRRLGSELHDGLCQQLTAALLRCTALENDLSVHGAQESAAARKVRAGVGAHYRHSWRGLRSVCRSRNGSRAEYFRCLSE
jgi:signal transduction histidine kinase